MNVKTIAVRESEIERRWFVVDATDETLGRLASRIARVLEGKHKPTYQPNLDSGDHVIVLNAARIAVTSDKLESKLYIAPQRLPARASRQETLGHLLARRPEEVIRRAVKGMLPHTTPRHPAAAQAQGLRRHPITRIRPSGLSRSPDEEPEPHGHTSLLLRDRPSQDGDRPRPAPAGRG